MKMSVILLKGCSSLALISVLLAPFAFGAVNPDEWGLLAWTWIFLGLGSALLRWRSHCSGINPMPRWMVALHGLFAIQLVPLPAVVLFHLSPGSFAAHFLPPIAGRAWAPLTASPIGTTEAWLFVIGLHGLAIALFGGTPLERGTTMRRLFMGMSAVGAVLALEGLVQSKSEHPYWLYGIWPVPGAGAHERGIFGPYYNRDHYSNLIALAGAVTAALLGIRFAGTQPLRDSFLKSRDFGRNLALIASLLLMITASAASGSRGGLVAMAVGVSIGLGPLAWRRPRAALGGLVLLGIILFATGVPDAFARMSDVDFEEGRLQVWRDALRLPAFFPIFGCGLGAFAPAYWPYQRVVRLEYWPHLHDEYAQWLIETGLVGLVFAVYYLRRAWIALPRIVRTPEIRPALAGLAAGLTHSLVDCVLRIPANAAWTALFLICLVTCAKSSGERSTPPEPVSH